MTEKLLKLLEQNKEFLSKDQYSRIKRTAAKLPDEVKEELIVLFEHTVQTKKLIDDYDSKRMKRLVSAFDDFRGLEDKYERQYKEAVKSAESESQEDAVKTAEESLKNL